jgi:hypothetical protein
MKHSWTQPSCNGCWEAHNPGRAPIRVRSPEDTTCCFCGGSTQSGIFVRVDPTTVRYPTMEKD